MLDTVPSTVPSVLAMRSPATSSVVNRVPDPVTVGELLPVDTVPVKVLTHVEAVFQLPVTREVTVFAKHVDVATSDASARAREQNSRLVPSRPEADDFI